MLDNQLCVFHLNFFSAKVLESVKHGSRGLIPLGIMAAAVHCRLHSEMLSECASDQGTITL